MNSTVMLFCGLLLATSSQAAPVAPAAPASSASKCASDNDACFAANADKIDQALGRFKDITVFRKATGKRSWQLVSGQYVPVTVNDKTPAAYVKDMPTDRPMMLPTRVQGFTGGDGQSSPYSVAGRMPGSNPEVQWVFVVRQYSIKKPTDADFPHSGDMAVIGHHPRTGATTFLQFYDPAKPKSGEVVVSPWSQGGAVFWSPVAKIADEFACQRCHNAGPFIHTPWVNQVSLGKRSPKSPPPASVVPSDPLGPYYFVNADAGEPFAEWDKALRAATGGGHLDKPNNQCTGCHRIAPNLMGLNQNATRYAGLKGEPNPYATSSDGFQTEAYRKLHWMPPLDSAMVDFYAGQATFAPNWEAVYGQSAAEASQLEAMVNQRDDAGAPRTPIPGMADLPRPPKPYQTIMADRPRQDVLQAKQSLWILDSRMRANTDGDLAKWRFFGKTQASDGVRAMPVVYRRKFDKPGAGEFEVVFVGQARGAESAGAWNPVKAARSFRVQRGDYLGVVFTYEGSAPASAFIPHTDDDWARLKRGDGTTWLRDGSVTYRQSSSGIPVVSKRIVFKDADFRTYSFEFGNKL